MSVHVGLLLNMLMIYFCTWSLKESQKLACDFLISKLYIEIKKCVYVNAKKRN